MALEMSVGDYLDKLSEPNAFYFVLLAAYTARDTALKPAQALEKIATSTPEEVAQIEEGFLRSLSRPVSQVIESVASAVRSPLREAEDQFGGGMSEEVLLRSMEAQVTAGGSRFARLRQGQRSEEQENDEGEDEGGSPTEADEIESGLEKPEKDA